MKQIEIWYKSNFIYLRALICNLFFISIYA